MLVIILPQCFVPCHAQNAINLFLPSVKYIDNIVGKREKILDITWMLDTSIFSFPTMFTKGSYLKGINSLPHNPDF